MPNSASILFRDDEDALRPVLNTAVASNRATTPSKGITTTARNTSNPRSGSATKDKKLLRAIHETETSSRTPLRATSRRKQRHFENDNLLPVHRILHEKGVDVYADDFEDEDGSPLAHMNFGLRVNWRSMFSELFTSENADAREAFRTCTHDSRFAEEEEGRARRTTTRRPIRKDEWAEAETSWFQIENRLRTIVARTLEKDDDFRLFVRALEAVVMFFLEENDAPQNSLIPPALARMLVRPITTLSGSLVVSLKDSSFHRLLLHAVCQFYGLHSKSMNETTGDRVTVISPPAKGFAFVIVQNVSLVGYVLATKIKAQATTTTSVATYPGLGGGPSSTGIDMPDSPLRHSDVVLVDISSMGLSD